MYYQTHRMGGPRDPRLSVESSSMGASLQVVSVLEATSGGKDEGLALVRGYLERNGGSVGHAV